MYQKQFISTIIFILAVMCYDIGKLAIIDISHQYTKIPCKIENVYRRHEVKSFSWRDLTFEYSFTANGQSYTGQSKPLLSLSNYKTGDDAAGFYKNADPSDNGLFSEIYEMIATSAVLLILTLLFQRKFQNNKDPI